MSATVRLLLLKRHGCCCRIPMSTSGSHNEISSAGQVRQAERNPLPTLGETRAAASTDLQRSSPALPLCSFERTNKHKHGRSTRQNEHHFPFISSKKMESRWAATSSKIGKDGSRQAAAADGGRHTSQCGFDDLEI